jgi:hypothetical protein
MPETRDKPHPTPHPDQPRRPDSVRPGGPSPARTPHTTPKPDADVDDSDYDSVNDDLNRVLSESTCEPDPALESSPAGQAACPPRDAALFPAFLRDTAKQPKTAEIFKSMAPAEQAARAHRGPGESVLDPSTSSTPVPDEVFGRLNAGQSKFDHGESGSQSDDDQTVEPRSTWIQLLLLSYSSAVTLALIWVLWTGRSLRNPDASAGNLTRGAEEPASKPVETSAREPLPPIPPANVTSLHTPVRIGDLEITPLSIDYAAVELIRSIDPADYRRVESTSLILRLKLTNVSAASKFAPLDPALIRDQNSPLDRSYVATSGNGKLSLFPLAVDSEWMILGQNFPLLAAGESVETVIASEPAAEDRLDGEMTWRVRLRIGPYRTDILGVRFTRSDLQLRESRLEFNRNWNARAGRLTAFNRRNKRCHPTRRDLARGRPWRTRTAPFSGALRLAPPLASALIFSTSSATLGFQATSSASSAAS